MNRLKVIRAEKRMTQFILGVDTGFIPSGVSMIENGLVEPREDEKKRLAQALGVRIEEIFPARGGSDGNKVE